MAAESLEHVIIVGLEVIDDTGYAAYREQITPMLEQLGGSFGLDLVVSRVLKSTGSDAVNRVFSMIFPSCALYESFFADPAYKRVRAELFEPAVKTVEMLAEFDR